MHELKWYTSTLRNANPYLIFSFPTHYRSYMIWFCMWLRLENTCKWICFWFAIASSIHDNLVLKKSFCALMIFILNNLSIYYSGLDQKDHLYCVYLNQKDANQCLSFGNLSDPLVHCCVWKPGWNFLIHFFFWKKIYIWSSGTFIIQMLKVL